jgi:hypothetical protein
MLWYSQNSPVSGIGQLNQNIYVGHLDDNNNQRVMEWNGFNWTEILDLQPVDYYQLNSDALTVFQNKLYYVFGNSMGTYTSCSGNETMTIAVYDGQCWSDFEAPYDQVTYIASDDDAGLLCIAYSTNKVTFNLKVIITGYFRDFLQLVGMSRLGSTYRYLQYPSFPP